ncbi:MAG: FAD-dependent oxidoreductase [Chloroflexi bacterium]|nr:FAD-dependent oxidoreductase [Chloroflexota bacterium]
MAVEFKYLFTPLKIGPVTVRNRLMTTAHMSMLVDPIVPLGPGFYGERYACYQAERAKGGIGLIIYGQVAVHPSTVSGHTGIGYDERAIPGFQLATRMIHEHGAKTFAQLYHNGQFGAGIQSGLLYPKAAPWAPSANPAWLSSETPKEVEVEELKELVSYYGKCAAIAKEGGFDGIEVHSCHGYLLEQFLSPFMNTRKDEYGGPLENRMRLHRENIDSIRAQVGNSMALGLRIPGDEFVEGGLSPDDLREIAQRLEATGQVDYVSVSVSRGHGPVPTPTLYDPQGVFVPLAAHVKEGVSIPVFTVGRIVDPVMAEKVLAEGQADMVAMTRAHLADPEIGNKAREGRLEDIRPCVSCHQGCLGWINSPLNCVQNPEVAKEKEWGIGTLKVSAQKKRVLVVGGGPGGLEAARMASLRGHEVTLYEKENELGGQIRLACRLPGRNDLEDFARWRRIQVEKQGVKVVLGMQVTPEMVAELAPDAVIVATGSSPIRNGFQGWTHAPIAGWEQRNVTIVEDILLGKAQVGNRVVVYDTDNHIKGPGIAEYLAGQGKQVELLTRNLHTGAALPPRILGLVLGRLAHKGVKITTTTELRRIVENSVVVADLLTGKERTIEAVDTVVLVTGNSPQASLYFALKGKVRELYRIGDCQAPSRVDKAIYQGYHVGRTL